MESFKCYTEFESFRQRLAPLTPQGKDIKESRIPTADLQKLESWWQDTEYGLELLRSRSGYEMDRIEYNLRRIPRIPLEAQPEFDEAELFAIKKFLYNYRLMLQQLPGSAKTAFSLPECPAGLEELLSRGSQYAETFFIADEYSEELHTVRADIRELDRRISEERRQRLDELACKYKIQFDEREFVIANRSELPPGEDFARLAEIEACGNGMMLVRPRQSAAHIEMMCRKQQLLDRERELENGILVFLSCSINGKMEALRCCSESLGRFDMGLASARLAVKYRMIRPKITADGHINIKNGRFIPCEEYCEEQKRPYQPLNWEPSPSITVLFGSNMGGKTIALKTFGFLQLCVQYGLFVPAEEFSTRLFDSFCYIGEDPSQTERRGLSGFGFEISQYCKAEKLFQTPCLILFDEFARTTNSSEAEAIISAIMEDISRCGRVTAVFSTHFRGIARLPGIKYLRMKGLDRQKLAEAGQPSSDGCGGTEQINRFMDYRPVEDDPAQMHSDAIEVAELLGLSSRTAKAARKFLNAEEGPAAPKD